MIKNGIIDGSLNNFNKDTISIGKELAISLNLVVGDEVTLMSTSNLQTPFGNLPIQEKFIISSIFTTGLAEFDKNIMCTFITLFGSKNDDNVFYEHEQLYKKIFYPWSDVVERRIVFKDDKIEIVQ